MLKTWAYRYSNIYKKNGNKSKTRFTPSTFQVITILAPSRISFSSCILADTNTIRDCLFARGNRNWRLGVNYGHKIYWQQSYCGLGLAHLKENHSLKTVHSFLISPRWKNEWTGNNPGYSRWNTEVNGTGNLWNQRRNAGTDEQVFLLNNVNTILIVIFLKSGYLFK